MDWVRPNGDYLRLSILNNKLLDYIQSLYAWWYLPYIYHIPYFQHVILVPLWALPLDFFQNLRNEILFFGNHDIWVLNTYIKLMIFMKGSKTWFIMDSQLQNMKISITDAYHLNQRAQLPFIGQLNKILRE